MQDEDSIVNPRAGSAESLEKMALRRLSRRRLLKTSAVVGAAAAVPFTSGCAQQNSPGVQANVLPASRYQFDEIARGADAFHHVPDGYDAQILLRWGDPLFPDAPAFDPNAQSAAAQARQFGYNCDFTGFLPLPPDADGAERGLLCVNHEYCSSQLMLPGVAENFPASMTQALCAVEMAAHGGSVVEIRRRGNDWHVVQDSSFNRRIMATNTPMLFSGPAAGNPRLQTSADPDALHPTGTLNNCAGGITPWGTYLMAEENFHGYFLGDLPEAHPEADNHSRYGVPQGWYQWGRYDRNFNLSKEPNGPNRFGWVVEVDLLDPASKPIKRTALGRFKHEGAESILAPDGRVVVYMGDDERFEYVYKFVSANRYDPDDRLSNLSLLDEGTLYVARFGEEGDLFWLPLIFGDGPLTAANGFASQADVVIEARRAADLLSATPMDRPEDVEAQPGTGKAYVMLTNNHLRTAEQTNAANPRATNAFGHIVELSAAQGDHAATSGRWEILIQGGDPQNPEVAAQWNEQTSENGWFGSPDNCAFDPSGRMWVATDGNPATGAADGLWGVETEGPLRGTGYAFFRAPVGAEVCGPRFTLDGRTLFLSVQHPGDTRGATFDAPGTRWPDFEDNTPPRPSVVAIYRKDGGRVGG